MPLALAETSNRSRRLSVQGRPEPEILAPVRPLTVGLVQEK